MEQAQRRAVFFDAFAQVLGYGIVLETPDIEQMLPYYGYSAKTAYHHAVDILKAESTHKMLSGREVAPRIEVYMQRKLIYDEWSVDVLAIESVKATIKSKIRDSRTIEARAAQDAEIAPADNLS